MTTLQDELARLGWTDAEGSTWRSLLRAAERCDGDDAEYAAFVSPGFQSVNADALSDDGIGRFLGPVEASLAETATERASKYEHPYTAAILLDYAASDKPKSRDNRAAALAAANRYIDAVEWFATSGAPRDHVLAIGDAVARAVDLLVVYGEPVDRLADAVRELVPKFSGTDDEEFIGALATALTRRLRQRSASLRPLFETMMTSVEGSSAPLKRIRCAVDLAPLAGFAGEMPKYKDWSAGLVSQAVLGRVGKVDVLVSAFELREALRLASEAGHPVKDRLLTAFMAIKLALKSGGISVPALAFEVKQEDIQRSAEYINALPDVEHRIVACSHITVVPTDAERDQITQRVHPGPIASLVNFVAIGDHGPTADDPDSLAAHHAMEMLILARAQIVEEVLSRINAPTRLPAAEVADLFQVWGLIEPGQEPLFAAAWDGWSRGSVGPALFALFPFVEQVYRNACGRGLGRGRQGGVVVRVGETLTTHVRNEFGNDVAEVYDHLLVREGARRHGFAHGYQHDMPELRLIAAYCIYLLCVAYAHVRQGHDVQQDRVRVPSANSSSNSSIHEPKVG